MRLLIFADCHVHSTMSADAKDSYEDETESAIQKGLGIICFTEHADDCCTGLAAARRSYLADRHTINDHFAAAKGLYGNRIQMYHGIELGNILHSPEKAQQVSALPELDFIIGSLHAMRGCVDFCRITYTDGEQCRDIARRYMAECLAAAKVGCCDVFGHLGYIQRYMARQGQGVNMLEFTDEFRTLFLELINAGIGIEVNTSGLRDKANTPFPLPPLVKLYRECGGEIITVGSDAHTAEDVGRGIPEAYELLKDCGFRYVAVFKKRKPEFLPL